MCVRIRTSDTMVSPILVVGVRVCPSGGRVGGVRDRRSCRNTDVTIRLRSFPGTSERCTLGLMFTTRPYLPPQRRGSGSVSQKSERVEVRVTVIDDIVIRLSLFLG